MFFFFNNIFWTIFFLSTSVLLLFSDDDICMQPYDPSSDKQGFSISEGHIANLNDEDYVVDIKGKDEDDGAQIIAWEFHGGDNQHWDIEYFD